MENQEETKEQTGTPQEPFDMAKIEEASDEDLDAALDEILKMDWDEESQDEPEDEAEEPQSSEPAEDEQEAEPAKDAAPKKEEQPADADYEARLEKYRKQIQDKEQFIQRQANEIGELRKEKLKLKQELENSLEDTFAESVKEGLKQSKQIEELGEEIKELDTTEALQMKRLNTEKIVSNHLPVGSVSMPELVEALKEDKVSAPWIEAFQQDPYGMADPITIIQLGKRAILTRYLKTAIERIKQYEQESKELKAKPDKVLSNIKKTLSASPSINGKSGGSKSGRSKNLSLDDATIASLPDDQLDELLNELK